MVKALITARGAGGMALATEDVATATTIGSRVSSDTEGSSVSTDGSR